jgi:hypothetical protein
MHSWLDIDCVVLMDQQRHSSLSSHNLSSAGSGNAFMSSQFVCIAWNLAKLTGIFSVSRPSLLSYATRGRVQQRCQRSRHA